MARATAGRTHSGGGAAGGRKTTEGRKTTTSLGSGRIDHPSVVVARGADGLQLRGLVPAEEDQPPARLQSDASNPVIPKREHTM
jgi:hypothetical protein